MRNPRVMGWMVGSAALHLALLAAPLAPPGAWTQTPATLEVSLDDGGTAGDSQPARTAPPKPATKAEGRDALPANEPEEITATPVEVAATQIADLAAHVEPASSAATSGTSTPEASSNTSDTVIAIEPAPPERGIDFARVIDYLRDLIEHGKVYPLLARQRGWEGEVLLAFRIVDDGSIRSAHVARSSGNRLLDQSALQALLRIERVTSEVWHNGDDAELQLSVVYRLIKS
jgi:protein TonB